MNAQLSDFLRSRRARLSPQDVGLAGYGRRRVPGLRREEVAQLAGVSTDYYIRLEQGRGRQVSDAVLDAVSRALRLDPTEHAYLHDLARPHRATGRGRQPIRRSVRHLLESMRDTPAIVVDHRMVIVTANALGVAVFGLTDDLRSRDRARQFFLDPKSRAFFPDWAADAESVAAELRLQAARRPDDQRLTALIGELCIKSAEFRTLWADHKVREKTQGRKRINHPTVGELVFTFERLALADDDEQTLIVYTVEPGSPTAERLAVLASWTAAHDAGAEAEWRKDNDTAAH
ncbi:helix-turn-helix domain-containing protein [Planotetraspora silvatica]|uniref:helix-turn-helix domain-containing protein n=1 Tax=Planotetraspora silvatica TaxID=234614 RepID=UPI00194E90BE|nr:helix-turn-helix transcriptional regulator [Planotetraspora silvatica]